MQSKSIVVVEDDKAIREVIQQVLELSGYRVFTASNGKEGVELLKKTEKPGVVLLDLMMPVMDGYEFLANQKKDAQISGVPVVVLSASGVAEKPAGAQGYYQKPIELGDLLKVAQEYCEICA